VQFRLTGKDKARVATRLALVSCSTASRWRRWPTLDTNGGPTASNPATATSIPTFAPAPAAARPRPARIAPCRQALAISAPINSVEADQLRADIYWRGKNWTEAAKTFARHDRRGAHSARASRRGRRAHHPQLGHALTLSRRPAGYRQAGGDLRRGDGGRAPSATPPRHRRGSTASAGDIRQLAGKVAQVGDLQGFMASYRDRLAKPEAERDELGETPPGGGFRCKLQAKNGGPSVSGWYRYTHLGRSRSEQCTGIRPLPVQNLARRTNPFRHRRLRVTIETDI